MGERACATCNFIGSINAPLQPPLLSGRVRQIGLSVGDPRVCVAAGMQSCSR